MNGVLLVPDTDVCKDRDLRGPGEETTVTAERDGDHVRLTCSACGNTWLEHPPAGWRFA